MSQGDSQRPFICFVHIERAGGTTLHHVLRSNYPSFLTLSSPIWTNEEANVLGAEELGALVKRFPFSAGVGGHHTRAYAGYESVIERPMRYFTFLRDPLSRYISHFNYQVFDSGHAWTRASFLADRRFDNFCTNRLAGEPNLERAKEELENRFDFVGFQDSFDESLVLLGPALGLEGFDPRYEKQNESRDPRYDEKKRELRADQSFIDAVAERNALDVELFDYAKRVLQPRYREAFGAGLESSVEELRVANESFRFSRVRRTLWRAFRFAGYGPVERRLRRHFHAPEEALPPAGRSHI